MKNQPKGFKVTSDQRPDGTRAYKAVAECRGCGTTHEIPMNTAITLPPAVLRKKLSSAGWNTTRKRGGFKCPSCAGPSKTTHAVTEPELPMGISKSGASQRKRTIHGNALPVEKRAEIIYALQTYPDVMGSELSEFYGVSDTVVSNIRYGRGEHYEEAARLASAMSETTFEPTRTEPVPRLTIEESRKVLELCRDNPDLSGSQIGKRLGFTKSQVSNVRLLRTSNAKKASDQMATEKAIPIRPVQPPEKPLVRDPSYSEVVKIQARVTECFDPDRGVYLDGQTDKTVGVALNIPWALVAKVRKDMVGELKEDPALTEARGIADRLTAEADALRVAQKELDQRLARVETGLLAIYEKIGTTPPDGS